ncbi:MAG: hypothetical protein C4537_03840 [Acholeplasma sp.]|nr:MAG: hypothetical protein C4537_03840 [Acholeplasma sp.]
MWFFLKFIQVQDRCEKFFFSNRNPLLIVQLFFMIRKIKDMSEFKIEIFSLFLIDFLTRFFSILF